MYWLLDFKNIGQSPRKMKLIQQWVLRVVDGQLVQLESQKALRCKELDENTNSLARHRLETQ